MSATCLYTTELWQEPVLQPELIDKDVHIWLLNLDQPVAQVRNLFRKLSMDERHRALRFYFQKDRKRFIVARGSLRTLLCGYLNLKPRELRFSYNDYGKPSLESFADGPALNFNLSHSHDLALIAFTRAGRIGVDLEFMSDDFATYEIASRFFSSEEVAALRSLPVSEKTEGFFNCWTRKEAYVKARGEGLSHPLDKFSVSLAPGEPACLLGIKGQPSEVKRWSLHDLSVAPHYAAAVAVENPDAELKLWRVRPEAFVPLSSHALV